MFSLRYFCTVPPPLCKTTTLSPSLSPSPADTFRIFLAHCALREACEAGTRMRFLNDNLFILSE